MLPSRSDEIATIENFIANRGVTRCPASFAADVAGALPRAEETARLRAMRIKGPTDKYAIMNAIRDSLFRGKVR
jgi:hypothetical protein